MSTQETHQVKSGLFRDATSAEAAYQCTLKRGYKPDEINVFMSDKTRKTYPVTSTVVEEESGDKSMEGLALGGALGGTIVGTLAAVLSLSGTIVIPGLGLVIAGPLAAGLVGAGAGSIAGGFIGAMVGAGITEERAKIYEDGIKQGGTVLVVNSHNNQDDKLLVDDWKKNNGTDIY